MYGRYSSQKFTISKATLPALHKKKVELEDEISTLVSETVISNLSAKLKEKERLETQIALIRIQIRNLEQEKKVKSGFLNTLLREKEITPEANRKIDSLRGDLDKYQSQLNSLPDLNQNRIAFKKEQLKRKREVLTKVNARIQSLEDKKESIVVLKNQAAKQIKEKRQIGDNVKRRLTKNENCPYCGEIISDSGHVDHIYPVSKGGHSVAKNMVHVCSDCNMKKSNLTLTMFIKRFHLDRDDIEERLTELKKDF
jgi:chromosome segregation ATPase